MSEWVLWLGGLGFLAVVTGVKARLSWIRACARIDGDVAFLRSVPAGMEWGQ